MSPPTRCEPPCNRPAATIVVQPLRDDLAVGPLRGIDDTPEVRAEFWQRVIDERPTRPRR